MGQVQTSAPAVKVGIAVSHLLGVSADALAGAAVALLALKRTGAL